MTNLSGAHLNSGAAVGPQGEGRDSPSRFPEYPAYKDSGVEWLGEVPEHWSVLPVKWVGWLKGGAGFPHDKQGVDSYELDFHKVNALASADSDGVLRTSENTITRETAKELGAYIFPKGTIVFAKVGAALLLGRLRTISAEACLDNNMMGLIVFPERASNQYALYSMGTVRFDLIANPGAVPSLNEGQIGNYRLAFPGLPEQTQIARFLDHETARIDALIEEQQRLIELLKEKRQAVISHAVTKGLDPTMPMKDSGVEWLGEVPAHWELTSVKYVVKSMSQGWSPQCDNYPAEDGEWGVLKVGCVNGGKFNSAENKRLPDELEPDASLAIKKGDLLISRANTRDLVGSAAVAVGDYPLLMLCDKIYRLRLNAERAAPEFLAMYLGSSAPRSQIELAASGASDSMQNISQSVIMDMLLPLPPVCEQEVILNVLGGILKRSDELIADVTIQRCLLKERRSALISAAVTGKIDVRGWQPPASASSPESAQEAV